MDILQSQRFEQHERSREMCPPQAPFPTGGMALYSAR